VKYTFLLYSNEADFKDITPEDMQQQLTVFGAYIQALQDAGVFVHTDWLQPSMTATKVSLRTGSKTIQDGPYADTKEQLGGFFVVDVPDLDAALAWAAKCPAAQYGIIEVRASAMPAG
jgi:hypothetical protein